MSKRLNPQDILDKKARGQKITMLTAYDFPLASFIDQCGIDMVLVGDSLANVVLGLESTREVTMEIMLHHAKAVNRGVKHALLVGDMPYDAFQSGLKHAVFCAKRFVKEAGCDAVKLEWFDGCLKMAEAIVKSGIPVMGHVGLTPQTVDKIGGFKVQGKDAQGAIKIMAQAKSLAEKGCFSLVLECIPDRIAKLVTSSLAIPTIGIGAGAHCDGQVLVTHDLLGLFERFRPKFAKQYVDLGQAIRKGVKQFRSDVSAKKFPAKAHSFSITVEELAKIKI